MGLYSATQIVWISLRPYFHPKNHGREFHNNREHAKKVVAGFLQKSDVRNFKIEESKKYWTL